MPTDTNSILLFDLGGVLIRNRMFSELKRLTRADQSEAELIDRWLKHPTARTFELGQCSEDEFARSVVAELALDLTPGEFLDAFRHWPDGFYDGAEATLARLREKYTVACLSNSNETHWTGSFTDPFDYAFSSHLIGRIKPDRDAFEHVLSTIGASPDQVYFFDDAPANVEAAREIGISAHHTVGFDQARETLRALGFLSD